MSARNARFRSSVVFRYFKQSRRTGRYNACVIREIGFSDSGRSLPFMNMTISTGTSVMASREEKPTASVFVHASGLNIRPSCASRRKTGRNETTIITSEKNNAGPTCFAAPMRTRTRSDSFGDAFSERCRYPFSTITMAASTKTPIARANPPSDMMFELTCR